MVRVQSWGSERSHAALNGDGPYGSVQADASACLTVRTQHLSWHNLWGTPQSGTWLSWAVP